MIVQVVIAFYKLTGKNFETSMGFEPVVSALVLLCSTNFAMKIHTLGASRFLEFNFGLTIA